MGFLKIIFISSNRLSEHPLMVEPYMELSPCSRGETNQGIHIETLDPVIHKTLYL